MDKMFLEAQAGLLSSKRYEHTKQVTLLATELAEIYNVDPENAFTAAMLHDITKEYDLKQQLQIINKSDIITDIANENTLHAITASLIARDNLGVDNDDVLNAIRYHTTGRADMSMLEKIVYVADKCSYDREYPEVLELRKLAFEDIDGAILFCIDFTLKKLIDKKRLININTIECFNFLIGRR